MNEDDSEQIIYVRTFGGTAKLELAKMNEDDSEQIIYVRTFGGTERSATTSAADTQEQNTSLLTSNGREQKTAILCKMEDVPTMVHSQYQQYDCTVVLHEPVHAFVPSGSIILTSEYVVAREQLLLRYNKK